MSDNNGKVKDTVHDAHELCQKRTKGSFLQNEITIADLNWYMAKHSAC